MAGISKITLATEDGDRVLVDLTGDNVTADTLVVGSVAHGANGEIVEGGNPYELEATNTEVGTQSDLIAQISAALEGKAAGGGITPSGTKEITANGEYDVTTYAKVDVNVPSEEPNIQPLNVTENGTYTPSGDVDGYGPVMVNVASSGDGSDLALSLLTREITSYSNPTLTYLGPYAFSGTKVTTLDLPALATIGGYVFYDCTTLSSVVFPALTEVPYNGFRQFTGLVKADLPVASKIGANGFYNCSKLETLILRRTNGICTLAAGTVLTATKIANGTGYVYVPASLVDTYKAATNWSNFADQIRAIEDYPDITGG